MSVAKIFFIGDSKDFTNKLLLADTRKRVKGFIRLGHDTQVFSFNHAFKEVSLLATRRWAGLLYKSRVDELLAKRIRDYDPDIIFVSFAKYLDTQTIEHARQAAPKAFFVGIDVDLWPELHKNRVQTAKKLDIVITTYDGKGLIAYKNAGIRCLFMPNMCDPDIEYRYKVSDKWKSDILFTGKLKHKHYPTEEWRAELVGRVSGTENCSVYGCCGRPFIGGVEYFYAISGAKIGLSINAVNDVRLYHSDRFTQYLACGTFVLAKRVPDTDLLFQSGVHLRYFDTVEEFFDLAKWYLAHEDERIKIANAGMQHAHIELNCVKIAKYVLDVIETGGYSAPWTG